MTAKQIINDLQSVEPDTNGLIQLIKEIISNQASIMKELNKIEQEELECSVSTDTLKFLKNIVKFIIKVNDVKDAYITIEEKELLTQLIKDFVNAESVNNYKPFNYDKVYFA